MEEESAGGGITIIQTRDTSTLGQLQAAMGLDDQGFETLIFTGGVIGLAMGAFFFYLIVKAIFSGVGNARMSRPKDGMTRGAKERDPETFRQLRKSRQKKD